MLKNTEKKFLLQLARRTLERYFQEKTILGLDEESLPSEALREKRGVFVTLTKKGKLRGCIGSIQGEKPLFQAVIENSLAAALFDPRFPPLQSEELSEIKIEISILSKLQPLPKFSSSTELLEYLQKNKPGIYLKKNNHQATFLPQVWEEIKDPVVFLDELCIKASLPADSWQNLDLEIYEYQVERFEEEEEEKEEKI